MEKRNRSKCRKNEIEPVSHTYEILRLSIVNKNNKNEISQNKATDYNI